MLINELEAGTEIQLTCQKNQEIIEFNTRVSIIDDDKEKNLLNQLVKSQPIPFVAVDAIRKDDKIVGFPEGLMIYRIYAVAEEKPHIWSFVNIRLIELPTGNKYHLIFSDKNVKPINRREAFRLEMNKDCVMQVGVNRKAVDAVIRDISARGIGIRVRADINIHMGDLIHVTFDDERTDTTFRIGAIAIRETDEDENGFKTVGCRLTHPSDKLDKYIASQQLIHRKN